MGIEIKSILNFFKPFFVRYRGKILISVFLYLFLSLLQLPLPLFTKYFIDYILPAKALKILFFSIGGLALFILIRTVVDIYTNYLQHYIGERIGLDIKVSLYEHIVHLPITYFEKNTSGYISSRIMADASSVQGLIIDVLSTLLKNGLTFIVGFVAIFILCWKLAVVSIILVPLFIYFTYIFSKRIREASYRMKEEGAKVSGFLKENIAGIRLLKEFQMEGWGKIRFFSVLKKYVREMINLIITRYKFLSGSTAISGIAPVIVLGYGGLLVMRGQITLGTLVAFSSFLGYLFGPVYSLMSLNQKVQEGMASVERIKAILALEKEGGGKKAVRLKGDIVFNRVSFSRKRRKILKELNIRIKEGERVLIKGRSGEGKTTLVNLIFGYYEPDEGEILIGGTNIKEVALKTLRQNIGYLSQDIMLFSGSLRENLVLNMEVKRGMLEEAIRDAGLEDTLNSLPDGLNTRVGEMGYTLSGGERKRIGLARVFLKGAPIVILDEPFSGVDIENRKKIKEVIDKLFREKTIIVISHDENEDSYRRVFYIEKGKIREKVGLYPSNNFYS